MKENIKQFLSYCERTGERPEKVFIEDKTYVVEWHPNNTIKRIYPKPLGMEEVEIFYASGIVSLRNKLLRCKKNVSDHEKDFRLWKRK